MVSGGMACIKYILFFFNFIFALTGVICIVAGSLILAKYNGQYSNFVDNRFFVASVIIIIVGIIVFLVSFFGCCGAVKENHCMIITFSVLLLAVFALEVGGGITGYVMRRDLGIMLHERLNKTMKEYKTNHDIQRTWDVMQLDFKCCGINNSHDWWPTPYQSPHLPRTCCDEVSVNGECDSNSIVAKADGCMKKFKESMEKNVLEIGIGTIVIALIQLIGVVFACCLARSIRREYETVYQDNGHRRFHAFLRKRTCQL